MSALQGMVGRALLEALPTVFLGPARGKTFLGFWEKEVMFPVVFCVSET